MRAPDLAGRQFGNMSKALWRRISSWRSKYWQTNVLEVNGLLHGNAMQGESRRQSSATSTASSLISRKLPVYSAKDRADELEIIDGHSSCSFRFVIAQRQCCFYIRGGIGHWWGASRLCPHLYSGCQGERHATTVLDVATDLWPLLIFLPRPARDPDWLRRQAMSPRAAAQSELAGNRLPREWDGGLLRHRKVSGAASLLRYQRITCQPRCGNVLKLASWQRR